VVSESCSEADSPVSAGEVHSERGAAIDALASRLRDTPTSGNDVGIDAVDEPRRRGSSVKSMSPPVALACRPNALAVSRGETENPSNDERKRSENNGPAGAEPIGIPEVVLCCAAVQDAGSADDAAVIAEE